MFIGEENQGLPLSSIRRGFTPKRGFPSSGFFTGKAISQTVTLDRFDPLAILYFYFKEPISPPYLPRSRTLYVAMRQAGENGGDEFREGLGRP